MELSESPPFVVEVFSGHRKLSAPFEAKSCKLKSLRKEPDKAKITLLSFFHPARDRILLGTSGRKRKHGVRRSYRTQDGSERVLRFRLEVR